MKWICQWMCNTFVTGSTLLTVKELIEGYMKNHVKEISPAELKNKLENNAVRLIDVREWNEYIYCKIEGAEIIPLRKIYDANLSADKEDEIVLYCHIGSRSYHAAQVLKEKGFKNVYNLRGGIDAYSVEVDPDIPRY